MNLFWAYLRLRALLWLLHLTGRLLLWAVVVAVQVAAAPVTLVAAVGLAGAWLRGSGPPNPLTRRSSPGRPGTRPDHPA